MSEDFIEKLKTPENKSYEDRMRKALGFVDVDFDKLQEEKGIANDSLVSINAKESLMSGGYDQTNYAKNTFDLISDKTNGDILKILQDKLLDKIIVDLGCGAYPENTLSGLKKIGIKSYVGVDLFNAKKNYSKEDQMKEEFNIDGVYVSEDMLKFIKMLPNNSVNYLINGIDGFIIQDDKYREELSKEIWRTMQDSGVVFGLCSDLSEKYFTNIVPQEFKDRYGNFGVANNFFIYKKNDFK